MGCREIYVGYWKSQDNAGLSGQPREQMTSTDGFTHLPGA